VPAIKVDEVLVRFALGQIGRSIAHRVDRVHGRERAAEHGHRPQGLGRQQLFLAAGAGIG